MGPGALLLNVAILAVGLVSALALLSPVLSKRTTEGLALSTTLVTLCAAGTWFAYACLQGNDLQVVGSVIDFGVAATILGIARNTGALAISRVVTGVAIAVAVGVGAVAAAGVIGLGVAATILTVVSRVPQTIEVMRRPGGRAVSITGHGVLSAHAIGWTLYGLLRGDIATALSSAWLAGQACFIAVRTAAARRNTIDVTSSEDTIAIDAYETSYSSTEVAWAT